MLDVPSQSRRPKAPRHKNTRDRIPREHQEEQGDEIDAWATQEHSEHAKNSKTVSLLDLADSDEPYNRERAAEQKKALERTAESDSQSLDEIDELF